MNLIPRFEIEKSLLKVRTMSYLIGTRMRPGDLWPQYTSFVLKFFLLWYEPKTYRSVSFFHWNRHCNESYRQLFLGPPLSKMKSSVSTTNSCRVNPPFFSPLIVQTQRRLKDKKFFGTARNVTRNLPLKIKERTEIGPI